MTSIYLLQVLDFGNSDFWPSYLHLCKVQNWTGSAYCDINWLFLHPLLHFTLARQNERLRGHRPGKGSSWMWVDLTPGSSRPSSSSAILNFRAREERVRSAIRNTPVQFMIKADLKSQGNGLHIKNMNKFRSRTIANWSRVIVGYMIQSSGWIFISLIFSWIWSRISF